VRQPDRHSRSRSLAFTAASRGGRRRGCIPLAIKGTERSLRLRTTPTRDEAGRLLGAVTLLGDITRLRQVDPLLEVPVWDLPSPNTSLKPMVARAVYDLKWSTVPRSRLPCRSSLPQRILRKQDTRRKAYTYESTHTHYRR